MAQQSIENDVITLLNKIPTTSDSNEQLASLATIQELVFNRDQSTNHHLLHLVIPYLRVLIQNQNAQFVYAILQFIYRSAIQKTPLCYGDVYEMVDTVCVLSYSSEKNIRQAINIANTSLYATFHFLCTRETEQQYNISQLRNIWSMVIKHIEHIRDIIISGPVHSMDSHANNNRSANIWSSGWKYLEHVILLLSSAKEHTVFRDPMRSLIRPDETTIDLLLSSNSNVLDFQTLERFGGQILEEICSALNKNLNTLTSREWCVAINSLSLIGAIRPQFLSTIIPTILQLCTQQTTPRDVLATSRSNLLKLLALPAAKIFVGDIKIVLERLGATSERIQRSISKSQERRRTYGAAPSQASITKAGVKKLKRTAIQMADQQKHVPHNQASSKRLKTEANLSTAPPTVENLVNDFISSGNISQVPNEAILDLVMQTFATSAVPGAVPSDVTIELAPSELKARMQCILRTLATPSSIAAIEEFTQKQQGSAGSRDPRRRRDPRLTGRQDDTPPEQLPIFSNEDTIDTVSTYIATKAATLTEPLVTVSEDNKTINVLIKQMSNEWYREMAILALERILESEEDVQIKGDQLLREALLCRLVLSPLLMEIESTNNTGIPHAFKLMFDFILTKPVERWTLADRLFFHESIRVDELQKSFYIPSVEYFFSRLVKKIDTSSLTETKVLSCLISKQPVISIQLLEILDSLFQPKSNNPPLTSSVVLGITIYRDLIRERALCAHAVLHLLLRYACHEDSNSRNSSIRCIANQLYTIDLMKRDIEVFALRLVGSLYQDAHMNDSSETEENYPENPQVLNLDSGLENTDKRHAIVQKCLTEESNFKQSIKLYATEKVTQAIGLGNQLNTEPEILRRLELFLALCAKNPGLLSHLVVAYASIKSDFIRQVIFHAIEKLIRHLKQRTSSQVIEQLHGFHANALGFVCHIIQILTSGSGGDKGSGASIDTSLLEQILQLYESCKDTIPDAISLLIPVLPNLSRERLFPLLPTLLSLPTPRLAVAVTKLLDTVSSTVVPPIDFLVALHHVDLQQDHSLQAKVIQAIDLCVDVQHRHAFPSDVLLHVCQVLVNETPEISKLAIRTLILAVTTYPSLQYEMDSCLSILVKRQVWTMPEALLWKGFVKLAVLIQPASFTVLLQELPTDQLRVILQDNGELVQHLQSFIQEKDAQEEEFHIPDDKRQLLFVENEQQQQIEA